jgi:hypothetical protein
MCGRILGVGDIHPHTHTRTRAHTRRHTHRGMDPRKMTHMGVFDPESLRHFLEELVLLAVKLERLLYLVFFVAAGVATLLLKRPDVVQQLFLGGT